MKSVIAWLAVRRFNHIDLLATLTFMKFVAEGNALWGLAMALALFGLSYTIETHE